jgi:hypothetical protein
MADIERNSFVVNLIFEEHEMAIFEGNTKENHSKPLILEMILIVRYDSEEKLS